VTRIALRRPEVDPGRRAGPAEAAAALLSCASWLVGSPAVVLHELAHVAAALFVGAGFRGAGLYVYGHGRLGPLPVRRVGAAFVMHDPIEDDVLSALVALAPAALLPVAWAMHSSGAPFIAVAAVALGGATVVSDVAEMVLEAAGRDASEKFAGSRGRHVFLVGSPDHWQLTLGAYE
jgi:hypothetical protein